MGKPQLEEVEARERLLAGVQKDRVKPTTVVFPGQLIPGETSVPVAFPGSLPPIWNLPFARNPFFTGREDLLKQLHTQLHTTQTAVALGQPQAISGLGGIGKTQLAIEYIYRFRSEYQAVLWARAETMEALNASYTEIANVLNLPQRDAQEQEVIVQAVKNWLRGTNGWLLILDNADDLAVVQPFLPTVCPGHLLLTTRAQILGKLARRLEVDTLDTKVGALLLLRRAGLLPPDGLLIAASVSDQELALVLTKELGGLPLALDQAGAYIEETQCSLADYLQQYQTRRAELLAHRGMLIDDHPEPVATTWSLSFAKVEKANPMAAELLRICAFILNNLAELYREQGKYAKAEPLYVRALAILERHVGAEHPETARILGNLAVLYKMQGKYAQAEPLYVRALAIREQQLGAEHPAITSDLNNLAVLYYDQEKYAQAELLFKRALAIFESLELNHPLVRAIRENYVALLQTMGRNAEAEP